MNSKTHNIIKIYNKNKEELLLLEEEIKALDLEEVYKLILIDLDQDENFNMTKNIIDKKLFDFNFSSGKNLNIIYYSILNKNINFLRYLKNNNCINIHNEEIEEILKFSMISEEIFDLIFSEKINVIEEHIKSKKIDLETFLTALRNKNIYGFKKLLELNTELSNDDLKTLFFEGCSKLDVGNFEQLIISLKKYKNFDFYHYLNSKNEMEENGLFIALNNKNYEMAFYLLKKGIDINQISLFGNLLECFIFDYKSVNLLLNNGFDVNKKNTNEDHPLIFLIKSKSINIQLKRQIIDLLFKRQMNINIQDKNHNNLLHYCVLFKESLNLVEFLEKKGIIDNQNDENITSVDLSEREDKKTDYIKNFNLKYDLPRTLDLMINFNKKATP